VRSIPDQKMWMHRLVSTFWTIQIHTAIHMPFIHCRAESKAVVLENARSLMFLYECIRAQCTSPAIRNMVAFYGFGSAVVLETMSTSPADRRRVERLKEVFEEDSRKSTVSLHATQVLDYIRKGCFREGCDPSFRADPQHTVTPPSIVLPYFGTIRIVGEKLTSRPILEDDFNPGPPATALHPPSPTPTLPQVQQDFYVMNIDQNPLPQPFGTTEPLNWDFNFGLDPNLAGDVNALPMDIDAWSAVW
jgi:hypothetical protein